MNILRFVDPAFPGFVELQLTDAHGRVWSFIDKVPVITDEELDEHSAYPRPTTVACEILERRGEIVRVTTERPWCVESVEGTTVFDVHEELVVDA